MVYCYKRETDGLIVERRLSMNRRAPRSIRCKDGVKAVRCFQAEVMSRDSDRGQGIGHWPIVSEAAGVHPSQIREARKAAPSAEFTKDGAAIFRSRAHRNQCLREFGMFDRDAGYGDYAGGRSHNDG